MFDYFYLINNYLDVFFLGRENDVTFPCFFCVFLILFLFQYNSVSVFSDAIVICSVIARSSTGFFELPNDSFWITYVKKFQSRQHVLAFYQWFHQNTFHPVNAQFNPHSAHPHPDSRDLHLHLLQCSHH